MSESRGSAVRGQIGAQGLDTSAGARFNLRFEGARGVLELSKVCRGEFVQLERARLRIPRVTFPLDVTQGAARFRNKRTLAESFRFSVATSAMASWANKRALAVHDISVLDARTFSCTLVDALGAFSVSFALLLEGESLVLVPLDAYSPVDSPKGAWQRLKEVLLSMGTSVHARLGGFALPRAVHWLFVDALVRHGYRAPVAQSAGPCRVRFVGERCVIESGDSEFEHDSAVETARNEAWLVQLQRTARLRSLLFAGLALEAIAELDASEHATDSQRADSWLMLREPALLRAECLASIENGEAEALFALRHARHLRSEGDPYVEIRLALRRQDRVEIVRLCERILRTETSWRLAAAAVRGCLHSLDAGSRRDLARHAFARLPADVILAAEVIAAVGATPSEIEHAAEIATRAMQTAMERAEVADAAARALSATSHHERAMHWAREAVVADPGRAVYQLHYGTLLADAGRTAEGIAHLRHAAAASEGMGDSGAASRAMSLAAACFERLEMPGAARGLLTDACVLDRANWRAHYALFRLSLHANEFAVAEGCVTAMAQLTSAPSALPDAADKAALLEALVSAASALAAEAKENSALLTARLALEAAARVDSEFPGIDSASLLVATALSKTLLSHPGLLDTMALPELARLLSNVPSLDRAKLLSSSVWIQSQGERRLLLLQELLLAVLECRDSTRAGQFVESLLGESLDIAGLVDSTGTNRLEQLLGLVADTELLDRASRAFSAAFERGGYLPAAIDLLAGAGVRNRDAGLLRAALELAEQHSLFALALDVIDYALHVVPEGNSRDALLARRTIVQSRFEAP